MHILTLPPQDLGRRWRVEGTLLGVRALGLASWRGKGRRLLPLVRGRKLKMIELVSSMKLRRTTAGKNLVLEFVGPAFVLDGLEKLALVVEVLHLEVADHLEHDVHLVIETRLGYTCRAVLLAGELEARR